MNGLMSVALSQMAGTLDAGDMKEKLTMASHQVRDMEIALGIRSKPQISRAMEIVSTHLATAQGLLREGRHKEALLLIRGAEQAVTMEVDHDPRGNHGQNGGTA